MKQHIKTLLDWGLITLILIISFWINIIPAIAGFQNGDAPLTPSATSSVPAKVPSISESQPLETTPSPKNSPDASRSGNQPRSLAVPRTSSSPEPTSSGPYDMNAIEDFNRSLYGS